MLELYHNEMSVCAQKVRICLTEKNLEWQGHHLNLRRDEQFDPVYLKLNPNAVVPTLVNNGFVVIDSTFINEYINDAFPDPPLAPPDPEGRATMRAWTKQLDDTVHAATAVVTMSIAFRYQFLNANSEEELEAQIEKVPNAAKRESKRAMIYEGVQSAQFPGAVRRLVKLLDDMEAKLEQGPWLAGETYSLADIGFTSYITRIEHLRLTDWIESRPNLARWFERVTARPSFDEGLGRWINPDYITLMKETGDKERNAVDAILKAA